MHLNLSCKNGSVSQDYVELSRPVPDEEHPRVLLAGEHVPSRYWSFMHGARRSGNTS